MTKVMGIVNVTPDSFSDGGRFDSVELAVKHALRLIDQGVDILDIGGESTRPGAAKVSAKEELERVIPVISALRAQTRDYDHDITISIDTRKSIVAKEAIYAGADIWNDVSGLTYNQDSRAVAAELQCPVILMHVQGEPETMQDQPHYDDAVEEVCSALKGYAQAAIEAGVEPKNISLDPGIGFGKRLEDNMALFKHIDKIKALGYPVLIGASRKSYIGKIDGSKADDRLGGSLATALWALQKGADIVRVHDVSETVQAMKVWNAIQNSN